MIYYFKLFGKISNTMSEVHMILAMGSSQLLLVEFIFSIRKAELMVAVLHTFNFLWMGQQKQLLIETDMMGMILLMR